MTATGEDDEYTEDNYNNFATDKEISPYSTEHQFKLTKALAVLHIKPSTFHSYYTSGKYDKAKKLLDNALKERMSLFWTTAYGLRTEKAEVGLPTLKDNDITTIHEAFQFLNKTYIEKRTKMLSVDQMRKNQVALRKGQKIGVAAKASKDETIANQSSKDNGSSSSSSIATRRSVRSAISRLETLGPSASENGLTPMTPTTKLSNQLGELFFESSRVEFLMNMSAPPEPEFISGPKLVRSKSRKSFRKKRSSDQEPYTLIRKGSDKIKAVYNFREYKASNYNTKSKTKEDNDNK